MSRAKKSGENGRSQGLNLRHDYQSAVAPEEPHEFEAELQLLAGGQRETLSFQMKEPGHAH